MFIVFKLPLVLISITINLTMHFNYLHLNRLYSSGLKSGSTTVDSTSTYLSRFSVSQIHLLIFCNWSSTVFVSGGYIFPGGSCCQNLEQSWIRLPHKSLGFILLVTNFLWLCFLLFFSLLMRLPFVDPRATEDVCSSSCPFLLLFLQRAGLSRGAGDWVARKG